MRGRRGGKTGPQKNPRGWPNAAGAYHSRAAGCCRGGGRAAPCFRCTPLCLGAVKWGPLRQCPVGRLGPGAASLTCHQGVVKAPGGGGPWAPGPWNWPQTRLASRGTPATETTAKPRALSGTWGPFFSVTKAAPSSGLFKGGKSPPPPLSQLPRQPPRPSPRTRNCLPPPGRFRYSQLSPVQRRF
jgi:hypothetical protein